MSYQPPSPPAGWYPNPDGRPVERYWDGSQWIGPERPIGGTEPPAGASKTWTRFRGLPWWAQALAWLLVWPALVGLLLWKSDLGGAWGKVAAVAVAVLITPAWLAMPFSDAEPAADLTQEQAEATPSPTPKPTTPAPSPSMAPSAAPTVNETPNPTLTSTPAIEVETQPANVSGELQVHFIDVGQGDATLLIAPDATVLIDTGQHTRSDVTSYLTKLGVETIDVVAITHPHADHIGQFDQIMAGFDVAEVWWSGAVHTTQTFERSVAALEASDAAYEEPRAGDATTVGSLQFEFVNPPPSANFGDLHDSGLAFRVTYGEVRFLFTGDSESATEQRMTAGNASLLDADVYQVGHHGSRTSSSRPLLDAATPAIAIYSAGSGNQYGHPHPEAMDRLHAAGRDIYGTDVHGTVIVTTDGSLIDVAPQRDASPVQPLAPTPTSTQTASEPGEAPPPANSGACGPGQVDINTAGFQELQEIIHIGPDRAQQILDLRPFSSVDSMTRISGIAEGRLRDIKAQGVACAS